MNHRTYGQTRDCRGCRFWSEMIAQVRGGGPVEAMCLAAGPHAGPHACQYTHGRMTCSAWESGEDGAIDEPRVVDDEDDT